MAEKGYWLTEEDRRAVRESIARTGSGLGVPSRRPTPTRRRVQPPGRSAASADELRGQFDSVIAASAGSNTYQLIKLKTSPAPVQLPTGSPAITESPVYVVDFHNIGNDLASGDWVRAIRSYQIDQYNPGGGLEDVNWECVLDGQGGGIPFTCLVTATLTAATWSNTNKRLTPAANTNTCVLLGWDDANSRYDEATDGTTFSPDWVSTQGVTVASSKAYVGRGVLHDGRYQLFTVDCDAGEIDYTE